MALNKRMSIKKIDSGVKRTAANKLFGVQKYLIRKSFCITWRIRHKQMDRALYIRFYLNHKVTISYKQTNKQTLKILTEKKIGPTSWWILAMNLSIWINCTILILKTVLTVIKIWVVIIPYNCAEIKSKQSLCICIKHKTRGSYV